MNNNIFLKGFVVIVVGILIAMYFKTPYLEYQDKYFEQFDYCNKNFMGDYLGFEQCRQYQHYLAKWMFIYMGLGYLGGTLIFFGICLEIYGIAKYLYTRQRISPNKPQ